MKTKELITDILKAIFFIFAGVKILQVIAAFLRK